MLNIVYCCDDAFSPYVGISMVSCIKSNFEDFDNLTFHIVEYQISETKKLKLEKIVEPYDNCNIIFYPFESDIDFPVSKYPPIVYSTLFLPELINEERVIYLDSDTIIMGSFKDLVTIDLEGNYCAAVLDLPLPNFKKMIGFSNTDEYYNSGVLLMDLEKLRKDNIQEKFINSIDKHVKYADQDVLNIVLKNKILKLHPKYNLFGFFYELDYDNIIKCFSFYDDYYSKMDIENAKKDVVCIHFINLFCDEPWKNHLNPQYDDFKRNMDLTLFTEEEVFADSILPVWKRIIHKILHILPPAAYVPFAKIYVNKVLGKFE